jgi:geranylgeranyl diphosphate synthase type II
MNNYLEIIDNTIIQHLTKYFKEYNPMLDICIYSLKNGKKIRPSISLDICKSLSNSIDNALFPSLIIEYIHTASLIIDDLPCMDNAISRRNVPTTYIKFGEAATQLSGIVFVSLAMDALHQGLNNKIDPNNKLKIFELLLSKFSKILGQEGIAGGQMLDLAFSNKDIKNLYTEKIDLKEMILKKTGALFEYSFLIGWLFGDGDIDKIDDLKDASTSFSMIYQILDDLDDIEEDKTTAQKSKNYAITNGKENSIKDCLDYIIKFKLDMIKLNIYSDYFNELMNYVRDKLEKLSK